MGLVIFLALVGVPIIEIAVFIEIGGRIGLGLTLVLIVATALVGAALLRQQGLATLSRARATLDRGELPVQELLDGVCLLVAGAFLLTPGFVTDLAGALLLIPAVRRMLQAWAVKRLVVRGHIHASATGAAPRGNGGEVIDGEYTRLDDGASPEDTETRR